VSDWREAIPAETISVELEIPHGNISVRAAPTGEPGYLGAESELQVESSGDRLTVHKVSGWPTDVEVVLPSGVRELQVSTGKGDVDIEGVDLDVEAQTAKGDVRAGSGGRGEFSTGKGDIRLGAWRGRIEATTGKGNIEVAEARGGLEVNTGNGDIRVGEAAGRAEVNTGKGNLVFGRLAGSARLQTGRGDVVVTDLADARLEVQTSRGNLALDGRLAGLQAHLNRGDAHCRCAFAGESFELTTDHGNLRVELVEESPLRIEAISGHGKVESTLPLVRVGRPGPAGRHSQRFVASLGGTSPTATLRLYSAHGDVWIGRPGEATRPGDYSERTTEYDFGESATSRAWADTLRAFPGERFARDMASLGEQIGKQVGESVEEAMARLEREMERLQSEMERVERRAEEESERDERLAEDEAEREEARAEEEERRAEEDEEREEARAEAEERLAEEEEERRERMEEMEEEEEERRERLAELEEERQERLAEERERRAEEEARRRTAIPTTASASPASTAPAEQPDSEMAVLEAVSRGEISVDEAMVLLARLEAERSRR
jgi:DUF4097 and DUF4098 domain-containing protein YvlB